uniref:Adenosine deaminase domain-containing protein n=1 Tax=Tetraselmis chuii TaxID=63592 RepID=A0A7S1SV45_9CHLO
MLEFCRQLPKVELHAHLNGSIRGATIRELARAGHVAVKLSAEEVERLTSPDGDRSLHETFALFDLIHQVTTEPASTTRITREVLEDLEADGVVYAELRTTPKANPAVEMSKRSYMEAVFAGVKEYMDAATSRGSIAVSVTWLLSINRRDSAAEAMETVELAASLLDEGADIVGVDLSGNPTVGEWGTWVPALEAARRKGLSVSVHAAEVWNPTETAAMIAFRPGRVGHMCCLDASLERALLSSGIPLELCLTSNVMTDSVHSYEDHHFSAFRAAGHPVALCTDDSGVFSTTLSEEFAIAAAAFGLSRADLLDISTCALQHTFCTDAGVKAKLGAMFASARRALLAVAPEIRPQF